MTIEDQAKIVGEFLTDFENSKVSLLKFIRGIDGDFPEMWSSIVTLAAERIKEKIGKIEGSDDYMLLQEIKRKWGM